MRPRPTKRPCTAEETTDDTEGQPTNRRGDGVCKGCSGKEPTSKNYKNLMLDTTGRQGDINQNHSELLPTPVGTAVIHKTADTVTTRSKGAPVLSQWERTLVQPRERHGGASKNSSRAATRPGSRSPAAV